MSARIPRKFKKELDKIQVCQYQRNPYDIEVRFKKGFKINKWTRRVSNQIMREHRYIMSYHINYFNQKIREVGL